MSKAAIFFLFVPWFAASVYAGYRLTERSFAWVDEPSFGLTPPAASTPPIGSRVDLKNPPSLLKGLSPQALNCIRSKLAPDQIVAIMRGGLSSLPADQVPGLMTCLK